MDIVEIKAKGMHHIHEIKDEDDLEILKAVLKKIENYATEVVNKSKTN